MASKLSPATPRPKMQRGSGLDGERISPATKTAAANALGDNSPKATRSPRPFSTEKKTPVSRGAELQQVQEELARTKEQLALMEKSKSNLLQDLARSKRQLEDLNSKLQNANEVSKKDRLRAEEMEHASFTAAEDWQSELETTKKQYEAALLELQKNKQAMENLQHELFVCIEAKDEAVRLAGEAMNAAESTAKRVEEMSAELIAVKGSIVVAADSASARANELIDDPCSARKGVANGEITSGKSTKETAAPLAGKKAELQNSLVDSSHLRSELETLKEDLAVAPKLATQQTTDEKSTMEASALLLAAKEAELQNALNEVSHYRSEMMNLKHELAVVQKSVMQQELYEKGTSEIAALLAKKDTELQIALQEASHLTSVLKCVKKDLALAQKSAEQTRVCDVDLYETELVGTKEAERNSGARLLEMTSEFEKLNFELERAKLAETKASMQLADTMSELEQLKCELAAASEAREKALVAENVASANLSQLNAEVTKAKESECLALASLSVLSAELKEVQEKLVKSTLEGSMLTGFIESLKADFGRIQLDLVNVQGKEMQANQKADFLSLELNKMIETSLTESKLMNEQVASAQAAMESLKVDVERQRIELTDLVKKEAEANEKIVDVSRCLQYAENELAELRRQHSSVSERNLVLVEQSEVNLKEISELKAREQTLSARVISLMQALEDKVHEVTEWERRVGISDSKSTALASDLENVKAELLECKQRESSISTKATALSVVLASLTEKNDVRLNELKDQGAVLSARVAALDGELINARLDLEEALTAVKVAKDEAEKLQVSLQLATLEVTNVTQERHKFSTEAARSKEDAGVVLVQLQEAKAEAEKAVEAARVADSVVQKQLLEIKTLTSNLQLAQDEGILIKGEVESVRNKLQATSEELQAFREEMEQLRQEAQASRREADMLKSCFSIEKEQAALAKDQAQAARDEVEQIKKEMHDLKCSEGRAQSLIITSENRLQDELQELQTLKLNATPMQEAALQQTHTLETESSCPMSQEDLEKLKVRVQQTEEELALALEEIENSHLNTQNLLKNLEKMKLEKEANEKAFLEVHQHLADTEKAKSNLEAEIQRLLDESKQWQMVKDAIDIPIHTEILGRNFSSSDCRDEKPQPDSPNQALELPISPPHRSAEEEPVERQERVMKEHIAFREDLACSSLRREDFSEKEEYYFREEASLHDEFTSVPTKKKKKTLLVRLGTLLEKKKHASQHTL